MCNIHGGIQIHMLAFWKNTWLKLNIHDKSSMYMSACVRYMAEIQ